ncbi:CAP domain-containing protein [Metabacillus sp. GX 13764]|uniref:CAP domain-containing protein n=1 Tax=Metabacillus kandeliae TaxID=2900151 RepID=UPI001E4C0B04|nr:CAP domain-containing protein [Metabacillus kandeliae]MCD7035441.1 CAP domain-containing protein [Metabacillus kandeliae]
MKKSFVLSVAAAAALFTFQGANGASAQELSQQNVQAKVAQIGNISPEQAQNLLKGQIDPQQIQELLKQQQGANSGQQQAPQGEQAQAPEAQAGQQGQPCPAQAQQQEQAQPEQAQQAKKQQAQAPVQGQATAQPEKKAANNTQKSDSQAKSLSEFEKKVVDLTNAEREKQGLKPLQADEKLSQVARAKSEDMQKNNYFDHQSPTYGSPFDMMKKFGVTYQSAGENIAMGQQTPEEVVQAWMNSEGHRKNILNPDFTHIGVGYVKDGNYWTQEFIGK